MADTSGDSFTELLQRSRREAGPVDALLPRIYQELHGLARAQLRHGAPGETLQPTALVNEVYLRLVDRRVATVADRSHFRSLCARMMRQILVDHARRWRAARRGGGRPAQVATGWEPADPRGSGVDPVALHEALDRLAALDPRKARVVELRVFGGMTAGEVAGDLGVSTRTVEGDWYFARAWLRGALAGE